MCLLKMLTIFYSFMAHSHLFLNALPSFKMLNPPHQRSDFLLCNYYHDTLYFFPLGPHIKLLVQQCVYYGHASQLLVGLTEILEKMNFFLIHELVSHPLINSFLSKLAFGFIFSFQISYTCVVCLSLDQTKFKSHRPLLAYGPSSLLFSCIAFTGAADVHFLPSPGLSLRRWS